MPLTGVEVAELDLVMAEPLGTAAGIHDARPVVVVRVVAGGVEGWGECAAMAGGTAVDPPVAAVRRALEDRAVPLLWELARRGGGLLPGWEALGPALRGDGVPAMAAAGLEMAVLDVQLRAAGVSLGAALGVSGSAVVMGGVVGIPSGHDTGALVDSAARALAAGAARVRVKIAPGWDEVPVAALRAAFPDLALQADANGAYRFGPPGGEADAGRLAGLDPYGLVCVEEPLAPGDLAGSARLAAAIATPVCLDESLGSPEALEEAIAAGACEVACVKPARLGGLGATLVAARTCGRAALPAFVGGFFEAGLGRSFNLAVAGLPAFVLPGDVSPPRHYLCEDPFDYPVPEAGVLAVPEGPGICPVPDPGALARVRRDAAWIPSPYT